MKNSILKIVSALILISVLIHVADASIDTYVRDSNNTTGMDLASDEDLYNAIHNITPEPPQIVLRGASAPSADTWTKENLIYTISGNKCVVTKYIGNATDLLVPVYTEIDGVSYHTELKPQALNGTFSNNTDIVSIQFGNTTDTDCITFQINNNNPSLFKNDTNLESVSFFAVSTQSGIDFSGAFENCTNLYHVEF